MVCVYYGEGPEVVKRRAVTAAHTGQPANAQNQGVHLPLTTRMEAQATEPSGSVDTILRNDNAEVRSRGQQAQESACDDDEDYQTIYIDMTTSAEIGTVEEPVVGVVE